MKAQNYEVKNERIKAAFLKLKKEHPERFSRRIDMSWSNWMFGMESLRVSAKRLHDVGLHYVELHGNHYGPNLGYDYKEVLDILQSNHLQVSGIAALFSPDFDLAGISAIQRQAAIDYIKREVEFASAVQAQYILIIPSAVGRITPYDPYEMERSAATLRRVADVFVEYHVKAAIEPIREAEVSLIHKFADAKRYIAAVDHPGVAHINGDVYHMLTEEKHIGEAILDAGDLLINLHLGDSNRDALGEGCLDVDTLIIALYLIGMNNAGRFVTGEPIGPSANPFAAMYGYPDPKMLDRLVHDTVNCFREREEAVMGMS